MVINSKNIQLGNVVIYENNYYKIDTISEEYPTLDTIEFGVGVVEWKDLQPVEITKEVLENNLGFVKIYDGVSYERYENPYLKQHFQKGKDRLLQIVIFNHNNEMEVYFFGNHLENIKFVHQLQQLCRLTQNVELYFNFPQEKLQNG